jgi:hypothetical protein
LCHLQHKLIGFYNRDEKCLLRGTDWVFKLNGLRAGFKGLNNIQQDVQIKKFPIISVTSFYTLTQVYIIQGLFIFITFPLVYNLQFQ